MIDDATWSVEALASPGDIRVWKVEANRILFQVTATARDLLEPPSGSLAIGRAWTEEEILAGIREAISRHLVSPPAKQIGTSYAIDLSPYDLYKANGTL